MLVLLVCVAVAFIFVSLVAGELHGVTVLLLGAVSLTFFLIVALNQVKL